MKYVVVVATSNIIMIKFDNNNGILLQCLVKIPFKIFGTLLITMLLQKMFTLLCIMYKLKEQSKI